MVEFHISAAQPDISPAVLRLLILGTVAMLAFGHCGESGTINAGTIFAFDMAGWLSTLFEVFMGDAGSVDARSYMNKHVRTASCDPSSQLAGPSHSGSSPSQWRLLQYSVDGFNVFGISLEDFSTWLAHLRTRLRLWPFDGCRG